MTIDKKHIIHLMSSGKMLVLTDQAVVSGGNFALGVLLARMLGLEVFGMFSLLWMGVLFALSLQQAFLTRPLMSLYAGKREEAEQEQYLKHLFLMQVGLSILLVVLAAGAWLLMGLAGVEANWLGYVPLMGGVAAVFLLQDFMRKACFVEGSFWRPLLMDLLLYIPVLIVLPILFYAGLLDLEITLWVVLAAYSASVGFNLLTRSSGTWKFSKSDILETAKEHYHFSIWLLGTSLLQWFSGNFFLIAAAGVLGTVAVGALRMAQNMVGLCHVLFLAMENIIPAEAARHFFEKGKTEMYGYLRRMSLLAGIPVLLLLGGLTLTAPWLIDLLYGAEYLPYTYLVGAYALLYVFVYIGYPLRFALRTLQFTSPIFIAYCVCAAVSVLSAFPITRKWGLNGVVIGLITTQALTLMVYVFFLRRKTEKSLEPVPGLP